MTFSVEEHRPSDSPFVEMIWRTRSESIGSFMSQAAIQWEMVVTKHKDAVSFGVHGPFTKAFLAPVPADAEWLGITFKLGTFMRCLPVKALVDGGINLPKAASHSFWLHGSAWEFPTYENVDTFVMRLEKAGLVTFDPVVDAVLQGHPAAYSPRALQYRFVRATGLPHKVIQQIERAKRAAMLLAEGLPILDTAYEAGYFDQSHLTNALKRFLGQTPAQIAGVSLSE